MELTERQRKIIEIIKENGPITGADVASQLQLTRATLRPDLSILTKLGMIEAKPKVGYFFSKKHSAPSTQATIGNVYVKEVKSENTSVPESCSVQDAIIHLFLKDCGTLYVTDASGVYLMGVLSRKDIIKAVMGEKDLNKIPVGMIMTRMPNVHVIFEDCTVQEAAMKLMEFEIDSLPVVEGKEKYKLIGRISKTTITKLFVQLTNNRDIDGEEME